MNNLHYKSNLKDIFFNLFSFLKIQDCILSNKKYTDIDEETARESLKAIEKLSINKLASSFEEGDRVSIKLDKNGNVTLSKGIIKSIKAFYDGGWHYFDYPKDLGGMGAPCSLYWSAFEMLVGANPSVALYLFGSFASRIIHELGTDKQKVMFKHKILEEQWGVTMVLTEPDAGSDVGAAKTQAIHIKDDIYHIYGVKRFITNGDFNYPNNILHMVLARVKDAKKGVKGLSMFLVPKIWINQDGSKGERNGVFCTNIEKKMGIKASATCEMTFGENIPAKGFLLGNVHQGIYQMFKIIEQARMAVGIKSMSTLSTAYLNALSFCKERIQGSDIVEIFNKSAKKVAIIKHPDIRRMLMMQKSHVEGMRALCMYCSKMQDLLRLEKISNGSKVDEYKKLVDLLLPLIKGYNSEKVYKLLSSSLQCFGGSGYLSDYPIEQYIRDQKIDSLYEGTTHIQALDLIMRKIARDNATALKMLISKIESTSSKKLYKDKLGDEYNLLKIAIIDIKNIFTLMMTKIGDSLYYVGLHGNKILIALSELVISWLLLRHAEVSISLLKTCSSKKSFYYGKIASASFYCKNVLPNIKLVKLSIEKTTLELMNLSDDIF